MNVFSITDVGVKRKVNQDFVFCSENPVGHLSNVFIVADGMGGHNAGDYASRFCVEEIIKSIKESKLKTPIGIIEQAVKTSNDKLLEMANTDETLEGMGTTLVFATIVNTVMYVANIGDSRLYLISDNKIKQITEDHSLVEAMVKNGEIDRKDARFHPNKNIITRALGSHKYVAPDYFEVDIKEGDTVLMCSDGLSNMIDDDEILSIINNDMGLNETGKKLINKANEYGGKDNIAIVMVRI